MHLVEEEIGLGSFHFFLRPDGKLKLTVFLINRKENAFGC
jgi:hypothetical protein